jgi:hypothetical protein
VSVLLLASASVLRVSALNLPTAVVRSTELVAADPDQQPDGNFATPMGPCPGVQS